MDPHSRYRNEAQKRLHFKKALDWLFFTLVGGPFLGLVIMDMLGLDLDSYLTQRNIFVWLGLYAALTLFHAQVWKCPRCEKSLARWIEKAQMIRPACRHCGQVLFPEMQKRGKVLKQKLALRPAFLGPILFLGLGSLAIGFSSGSNQFRSIGAGILFICLLALGAVSRIKSCPHCGHASTGGSFCGYCGGKLESS